MLVKLLINLFVKYLRKGIPSLTNGFLLTKTVYLINYFTLTDMAFYLMDSMSDFLNDNESFIPDFVFEGGDNNIFVKSIHTLNQIETTLGSINDAVTNINPIDEQTRSEIEGRVVQAHAILYIAHDIIIHSITIIQNIQDFLFLASLILLTSYQNHSLILKDHQEHNIYSYDHEVFF